MLFIMEGLLYNIISKEMHALALVLNLIDNSLSIFHNFTSFHNWENETFCVKCGLNADHFSSLVGMRAESAIAAFYGRTDFCVDVLLSDVTEENPLPSPLPSTKVSSETTSRSGLEYYRKS